MVPGMRTLRETISSLSARGLVRVLALGLAPTACALMVACGGASSGAAELEPTAAEGPAEATEPADEEPSPELEPPTQDLPAQPDDPCEQVVQGAGDCPGHWDGYQFDAESGHCVERGTGGCDAHIPFRSMEACQQACEESAAQ